MIENAAVLAPTPERHDRDGGRGETARPVQRSNRVAKVLLEDVCVSRECVPDGLAGDSDPQHETGEAAVRVAQALAENCRHLLAVLGAKRRWIEMEERAIEVHQDFPGASPLARASLTIRASRPASAIATSRPNGVSR